MGNLEGMSEEDLNALLGRMLQRVKAYDKKVKDFGEESITVKESRDAAVATQLIDAIYDEQERRSDAMDVKQ
jgi:hypothetical protein